MGGGEDGVHGGDVLGGLGVGDGDDEDAGADAAQGGADAGLAHVGGRGFGGAEALGSSVYVGEGHGQGAGELGGDLGEVGVGAGGGYVADGRGDGGLDLGEERVLVGGADGRRGGAGGRGGSGSAGAWTGVAHVYIVGGGGIGHVGFLLGGRGVEPAGLVGVGGDDGDLVGVAKGQMAVDEDEEVRDGIAEGEGVAEAGPGAGVGVEDDGEEGGDFVGVGDVVVLRGVGVFDVVHCGHLDGTPPRGVVEGGGTI